MLWSTKLLVPTIFFKYVLRNTALTDDTMFILYEYFNTNNANVVIYNESLLRCEFECFITPLKVGA